jgi:hypothetical protein
MGLFGNLLTGGDEPKWKVGDHRVREVSKTVAGTVALRKTRYRCVDCGQEYDNRDKFYEMDCYELIE